MANLECRTRLGEVVRALAPNTYVDNQKEVDAQLLMEDYLLHHGGHLDELRARGQEDFHQEKRPKRHKKFRP